ncbi:MAG: hypothetical protein JOZ51_26515 [Chloroflexi bacterium]|nr:hypothetical protein [Chloroflexota bacterium]
MESDWLRDYMLLALRLNKLIVLHTNDTSLLDYYGPPAYQAQVDQEPVPAVARLVHDAQLLRETVCDSFPPARATYLTKLVSALELVSRRVAGEQIALREQAHGCFDLHVEYVPETIFADAHALYNQALPGRGSLAQRLHDWQVHYTIPRERSHLLPRLIQRALDEARQRTNALIDLPDADQVTIEAIRDQPVRAMAHYLGNGRSRLLINPDYPFNLADLLYIVCHEAYPGHIAELCLKEEYLIRQQGVREQQVSFLLTPPFVISEGIALWAHELVFPAEEAARWLEEHIYPEAGIAPDGSQLNQVDQATDLLWGVRCNAALMLDEGYASAEVMHYLMQHGLLDQAAAQRALQALQRPFCEAYIFTYWHGRQLLAPWLQGSQRSTMLARLLTEQMLPSQMLT